MVALLLSEVLFPPPLFLFWIFSLAIVANNCKVFARLHCTGIAPCHRPQVVALDHQEPSTPECWWLSGPLNRLEQRDHSPHQTRHSIHRRCSNPMSYARSLLLWACIEWSVLAPALHTCGCCLFFTGQTCVSWIAIWPSACIPFKESAAGPSWKELCQKQSTAWLWNLQGASVKFACVRNKVSEIPGKSSFKHFAPNFTPNFASTFARNFSTLGRFFESHFACKFRVQISHQISNRKIESSRAMVLLKTRRTHSVGWYAKKLFITCLH